MQIGDINRFLETMASPSLQEGYDNAGLITGSLAWECTGILVSLDATEEVVLEAKEKGFNMVVAHHPIIFSGLKKINGKTYVERAVIASIKYDIAIYAIHTNLDNVITGVNAKMAERLGLVNCKILQPKTALLRKLFCFVPFSHAEIVRTSVFEAGGGHIGDYSECSFNAPGKGTFKGAVGTSPFVGEPGKRHEEDELKIEVIFPAWLERNMVAAILKHHPYEEPAYDIVQLSNEWSAVGSGLIGELPNSMTPTDFLQLLKDQFQLSVIRHTLPPAHAIHKVALCGGAGSFLTKTALAAGSHAFVTGDVKYHEFFDAENRLLLADIGHWESEQFTIDLLADHLQQKFPTFAVLKTGVKTNPVEYYK